MHACAAAAPLQAETPEAMVREMLRMSNLELQLRSQLAEETEARCRRIISEQQVAPLGLQPLAPRVAAPGT